jgi:2-hydroxy-3-keto-5-methylthiopentenyl-1-phosphate phosphatase
MSPSSPAASKPQPPLTLPTASGAKWAADGRNVAIFCDFDGTITDRDVIMMIMERFAPPQWRSIADAILTERTVSIREGLQQLFDLLPSDLEPEIQRFVAEAVTIRQGFEPLLAFAHQQAMPFWVVSGGLDLFIAPLLAPFADRLSLFANQACLQGSTIAVKMPYLSASCPPCDSCACCKIDIMDQLPHSQWARVVIGDSVTDLGMAQRADAVFARGQLCRDLDSMGIAYTPFHTFDEVLTALLPLLCVTPPAPSPLEPLPCLT